jgi:hypothetical protein
MGGGVALDSRDPGSNRAGGGERTDLGHRPPADAAPAVIASSDPVPEFEPAAASSRASE